MALTHPFIDEQINVALAKFDVPVEVFITRGNRDTVDVLNSWTHVSYRCGRCGWTHIDRFLEAIPRDPILIKDVLDKAIAHARHVPLIHRIHDLKYLGIKHCEPK